MAILLDSLTLTKKFVGFIILFEKHCYSAWVSLSEVMCRAHPLLAHSAQLMKYTSIKKIVPWQNHCSVFSSLFR